MNKILDKIDSSRFDIEYIRYIFVIFLSIDTFTVLYSNVNLLTFFSSYETLRDLIVPIIIFIPVFLFITGFFLPLLRSILFSLLLFIPQINQKQQKEMNEDHYPEDVLLKTVIIGQNNFYNMLYMEFLKRKKERQKFLENAFALVVLSILDLFVSSTSISRKSLSIILSSDLPSLQKIIYIIIFASIGLFICISYLYSLSINSESQVYCPGLKLDKGKKEEPPLTSVNKTNRFNIK